MRVLRHLKSLSSETQPLILAAGFFDGVHRGHQAILAAARSAAAECGGQTWVLTLDNHPSRVLRRDPPPLLTCNKHKLLLLRRYGVDGCLLLPFTPALASQEPEAFIEELRLCAPPLRGIVCGENWRFGHKARGDIAMLRAGAAGAGLRVDVVGAVGDDRDALSSTRVRSAVLKGDLSLCEEMLGRPFSVLGTVVHGRGVGHHLGYATANLECGSEAIPPPGVYAVHAAVGNEIHDGVLSFGTRPTFVNDSHDPAVELHLLDVAADLYGQDIEVFFIARLRDEKRFASTEELCAGIASDIVMSREILAARKVKEWLYSHCYSVL